MRINFLGGPDSRKTTTAADVFARLKRLRVSVEYVTEYVKPWAYEKRKVHPYDQFYLQAKQMQYEYRFLKTGVKNVVTDSPVVLGYVYAPENLKPTLRHVSDTFDKGFPSFNIFLLRGESDYNSHGRYQTREEAMEIDDRIRREVPDLTFIDFNDIDGIMSLVLERIDR
jgi:hypothetical protein